MVPGGSPLNHDEGGSSPAQVEDGTIQVLVSFQGRAVHLEHEVSGLYAQRRGSASRTYPLDYVPPFWIRNERKSQALLGELLDMSWRDFLGDHRLGYERAGAPDLEIEGLAGRHGLQDLEEVARTAHEVSIYAGYQVASLEPAATGGAAWAHAADQGSEDALG